MRYNSTEEASERDFIGLKYPGDKLSSFCNIVFKLMIFLAVFDGIRSRTPIANIVTPLKELSTFSLLIIILLSYKQNIQRRVFYFSNFYLFLYLLLVGTVAILANDVGREAIPLLNRGGLPSPVAMHFKNIESVIVVFVLLHYEFLTKRKITILMDYFVHLCVAYILFTLLFYFVIDLPSFFQKPWYGRISIGYPTSDAQILSFGLAYLVFGGSNLKTWVKSVYIFLLIIGVFMNATATGIFSVLFIFLIYILYYLFSGKVVYIIGLRSIAAVLLIVFVGLGTQLVVENLGNTISTYSSLFNTKIDIVSNKFNSQAVNTGSPDYNIDFSEAVRKFQVEKAFSVNKDIGSLAIGGPISLGTVIENENYFLIRSYGYAGLIFYYLWIAILLIASVFKMKRPFARLLIVAIGILIVTNSAIITTYLFGIAVTFALFVSYFYNNDEASVLSVKYLYD